MKRKDSHKANPLASVPVIAMLAMAPMAEGKQPAQFVPVNREQLTELLAQVNTPATQTGGIPQSLRNELVKQAPQLNGYQIHKVINCVGNKQKGRLVFASGIKTIDNAVTSIFYLQDDYVGNKSLHPPEVQRIIYHDLGDKSFLGIQIKEEFLTEDKKLNHMIREVRLDDTSAQYLIDFLAGETPYENYGSIKFKETKSPNLIKLVVFDY